MQDNEKGFREYLDMLELLSKNRHLENEVEEAEKMLTEMDRKKMPSYRLGLQEGVMQGIEQGIERGKLDAIRALVGLVDDEIIAERVGLSPEQVRRLREETTY